MRFLLLAAVVAVQSAAAPARFVDGLWATDGYGLVLDVNASRLQMFEVTRVSCIPADTLTAGAAPPGALAAYSLAGTPLVLKIVRDNADSNAARANFGFAASDLVLHRIARKPAVCDAPTPNTPLSNFDVFTATFAEHYPFFAEKKVDWSAVVAASRAKVTASTTPAELFTILAGMILPMEDAHTGLAAPDIARSVRPVRRTSSFVPPGERAAAYKLVEPYLAAPLRPFCQGQIEFGTIGTDIGYVRIRSFSSYSRAGTFEADTDELGAALDTIFANAPAWQGLVIDVRLNGRSAGPADRRPPDRDAVHRLREAGAKRSERCHEMDDAADQCRPVDAASGISRAGDRTHRRAKRQRGGNIYTGTARTPANDHPHR